MRNVWPRRVGWLFVAWALTYAVSVAADTDPQPVLLASLVAALAAVLWLPLDLADHVSPANWQTWSSSTHRRRGGDARVGAVQRALAGVKTHQDVERLHPLLVSLVDDRLYAHHGIDRGVEPERAAELLGVELSEFVVRPPSPTSFGDPGYLSAIVAEIERL